MHEIRSPAGDTPYPWEARTTVRERRALNRIIYHLRHEVMNASKITKELTSAGHQLEHLHKKTDELTASLREVAKSCPPFL